MQARIAEAKKLGDVQSMKKFQIQLVNSFAGRAMAVRRVSENKGSKTPGLNGETLDNPGQKYQMIQRLRTFIHDLPNYEPGATKRVWIPKDSPSGGLRPLGIQSISDRCLQMLIGLALDPAIESCSDNNSYGFRKFRSTHDAINKLGFIYLPRMKRRTMNDATWAN